MRNKTGQLYGFGPFVLDLDQHALLPKRQTGFPHAEDI